MRGRLRLAAGLFCLASVPLHAQSSAPDDLMRRVAVSVQRFVDAFTNVVAEEEYEQAFRLQGPQRRLKSDFLLVGYPGRENVFLTFRDVREVNGQPVRGQQERLTKLFLEPFEDAVRRAGQIEREGLQHSVSNGRLMNPLQVMSYLQAAYQENFTFRPGRLEPDLGPGVRQIDWEQKLPPGTAGAAMRGKAWVAEQSGRLVKTELNTGRAPSVRYTTTTFALEPVLGIDVPVEMRDAVPMARNDEFLGTARYGSFRRFAVRTAQDIDVPAIDR